jgi:hypothetical protein
METINPKIQKFADMLLAQTVERMNKDGLDFVSQSETVAIHVGKKYTRVDIGPRCNMSGRYMVVNETGEIFGIKAYGVIHRGHFYGTLDTVDDYFWGGYRGIRKVQ